MKPQGTKSAECHCDTTYTTGTETFHFCVFTFTTCRTTNVPHSAIHENSLGICLCDAQKSTHKTYFQTQTHSKMSTTMTHRHTTKYFQTPENTP